MLSWGWLFPFHRLLPKALAQRMGNTVIMGEQERRRALSVGKVTALPVACLGQTCQESCRNNKVSASSSGEKLVFNGAFCSAPLHLLARCWLYTHKHVSSCCAALQHNTAPAVQTSLEPTQGGFPKLSLTFSGVNMAAVPKWANEISAKTRSS